MSVEDASALAERLLVSLPRRWRHVQAVAQRAIITAESVPPNARSDVLTAAWLHDIGYSPEVCETGFHPVDGARYLRNNGWPERVVSLVAHHSGARFEAAERGLSDELAEFTLNDSPLLDALNTADLTTGPDGQAMTYDERMTEILKRYPEGHPVYRTWVIAAPIIRGCIERTEARLAANQPK